MFKTKGGGVALECIVWNEQIGEELFRLIHYVNDLHWFSDWSKEGDNWASDSRTIPLSWDFVWG